jgi:hypothetical protein
MNIQSNNKIKLIRSIWIVTIVVTTGAAFLMPASTAALPSPFAQGVESSFGILAGTEVTNTGPSQIVGSAGSNTFFTSDRFVAGSGVFPSITIDQSQSVNNWNHVVATYDGATVRVYRNTVSGSSFSSTGLITNNVKTMTLGVRGNQYFTGKIGLSNIYNFALSSEQIKQNFNALRGRYGI